MKSEFRDDDDDDDGKILPRRRLVVLVFTVAALFPAVAKFKMKISPLGSDLQT